MVDARHRRAIRNALSRLGQTGTDIPPSARAEAKRKAKSMLERLTRG